MADAATVVTSYNLSEFDFEEARLGALCAIVNSSDSYDLPKSVHIIDSTDSCVTPDVNYHGKGICRQANAGTLSIVVNSTEYFFNSQGKGVSSNSLLYKLLLLRLDSSIPRTGDLVTRGIEGGTPSDAKINVTGMSARDEFAKQALRGIIAHIEDPFSLSDTEISYYCAAAYKWAAAMMLSAANSREDSNTPATAVDVGSLDSNVERLLHNIEVAITDNSGGGGNTGNVSIINAEDSQDNVIPLTVNIGNQLYVSVVSNNQNNS